MTKTSTLSVVPPQDDLSALLTSWALALHDKAPSTRALYLDVLRRFARECGRPSLLDVTRQDVRGWLAGQQARGLARTTIRSRWIALRSFYGWATDEEEIPTNPMLGVTVARPDPPPTKFPSDGDLAALLKSCAGKSFLARRDLAMVRVAAATGCRITELCDLQVADVDLARGVAYVRHGKGDKARLIVFDEQTGAAVDRYLRVRARARFAHLPDLWLSRFGPFGRKGASHMIGRRCREAGIEPFGWHALRHRFAHTYLARGGQEGSLGRLGGWSDPKVMQRYGASRAIERAVDEYREMRGVI
jgi:integrase/recombinase XerD